MKTETSVPPSHINKQEPPLIVEEIKLQEKDQPHKKAAIETTPETHDLKKIHLEGILKKTYLYNEEECIEAIQHCKTLTHMM
jgi:hypothetical protein